MAGKSSRWARWKDMLDAIRTEIALAVLASLLGWIVIFLLVRHLLFALWRAVF
jgi:hypothetical protein